MIAIPAMSTIRQILKKSIAKKGFPTSRIVPNAIPLGKKRNLRGVAEMMIESSVMPVTFLGVVRLTIQRAMT